QSQAWALLGVGFRPDPAPGASGGGTGSSSTPTCGSHSSHFGRYQFQSPSTFIVAGSKTPPTVVPSISPGTPKPTPISLRSRKLSVTKTENTKTITTAALVTVPAVVEMPWRTASAVLIPCW